MQDDLLRAHSLRKQYGKKTVVRDVTLSVARGQCIAFCGHNGSGKSTLLKLVAGLVSPTSGTVQRARGLRIGYVPERFFGGELTAAQYLRHMGRIDGLSGPAFQTSLDALCADFYLEGMLHTPMKHLSKGTLQKVGVVQALLAPRDVLLLDEPLSGQDAASQRAFVQKAAACLQAGTALLLSCHEPYLVSRLATDVHELCGGALHAVPRPDVEPSAWDVITLEALPGQPPPALLPGCTLHAEAGCFLLTIPAAEGQRQLLSALSQGYIVKEFRHAENL